ncbi:cytochrome P450 [Stackebrandtia nassauensis]|uniref:Cytochrome P450-like protein n=1 Tax=Stackebrandtia nassauensis (strain DSM 44728 / CIP 108903 / NRRL B-16338 / NBRC 102104 / LLR-40K-21) TaxID=446470 RepID=D3Q468_STANL|nr:cytochrome P450 [Stackebrandtia nassauensis]ADD45953.1 Cytochrome P450-like protein [Stackebrandtia nassauensis DSM 44728]
MRDAPFRADIDPFAATVHRLTEPDPVRAALRAAGPLVQVEAPAGGRVWIITTDELARAALADPHFAKDPAHAPDGWDRFTAGLEPTAAEQPALTTLDGPEHTALRRAHAPLLSAKRIAAQSDRVHAIARELLAGLAETTSTVDLMSDFTVRYPITVLLDLLGVPAEFVSRAVGACRRMICTDPAVQGAAIAEIAEIGAEGLSGTGLAAELRERLGEDASDRDLRYHLFALIFAGQLTTDASLGFLVADALRGDRPEPDVDALVRDTLREHPAAPFSLWRFTNADTEIAGFRLPARAPVLIDIMGINTDPDRAPGPDLTFGGGAHFCVGAQLAQLELRAVATVLRTDYPQARLAVPYEELRQLSPGGIQGIRLAALPILLRP